MKLSSLRLALLFIIMNLVTLQIQSQNKSIKFDFDGSTKSQNYQFTGNGFTFAEGIEGQALSLESSETQFSNLSLKGLAFDGKSDFTLQFWIKTNHSNPTTFISQKSFSNKGIKSQKNKGWALYSSGGTLAWSIGSGDRRLTYERENGDKLALADGNWHQISMTFTKERKEVWLYFDGKNMAIYKVGFDFFNNNPIVIGSQENTFDYKQEIIPDIKSGAVLLQSLVDEFNSLEVENVRESEFLSLIVDPKELYEWKLESKPIEKELAKNQGADIFENIMDIQKQLSQNTYTVSQNHKLTALKPVHDIFSLKKGNVEINTYYAHVFGAKEQLYPASFSMDKLTFWKEAMSPEEIWKSYNTYQTREPETLAEQLDTLTVAVWNIWHGGKHFTRERDGWDSRLQIAEILKKRKADIVLMQETYSSGDFIAAELGYYFATTSDWDYKSQGANISVLSRFPIIELEVPQEAEFMNVGAKIALSQTQDV